MWPWREITHSYHSHPESQSLLNRGLGYSSYDGSEEAGLGLWLRPPHWGVEAPALSLPTPVHLSFLGGAGQGGGKEGWLTIAVHNLLSFSDVLCCPDGGDSASEGHTRVGAAGVVQEADDREDACGKADLPAVGHDAFFRP